jgi:hypothetical protein
MRIILSIPQQIQRALLGGDLDKSLEHLRIAAAHDEMGVVTEELKAVCLANVLRMEHLKGRIPVDECVSVAAQAFVKPDIPLAAYLVVIRLRVNGELGSLILPESAVLETLDVLASDTQMLSDDELLVAALALSR